MKRAINLLAVTAFAGAVLGLAGTSRSHPESRDAGESYRRARAVLDQTVTALGGREALSGISAIELSYTADVRARGQSASPDAAYDRQSVTGMVLYEEGGRVRIATSTVRRGGARFQATQVIEGDAGFYHNETTGYLTGLTPTERGFITAAPTGYAPKAIPSSLLRAALGNLASLRWIGERSGRTNPEQLIGFSLSDGTQITLIVDALTHLPLGWESVAADPLLGDAVNTVRYDRYEPAAEVLVPTRIDFLLAEDTLATWTVTAAGINPTIDSAAFAPPPDLDFSQPSPAFTPTPVGEHLWAMRVLSGFGGSYNIMFAEFEDHVTVIEAPLADVLYRFVAGVIRATVGDKPIRRVVATHYHQDHTGGVRAYLANGVTLLTGPSTAAHVERLTASRPTLASNPLAGITPDIEIVAGSRIIDEGLEMRLIQIGPTPHVDDQLLVYFPESRVLYTGDHFSAPENGNYGSPNESLLFLARSIAQLGLEVETFVPTHGPPATAVDFANAVGRTRD